MEIQLFKNMKAYEAELKVGPESVVVIGTSVVGCSIGGVVVATGLSTVVAAAEVEVASGLAIVVEPVVVVASEPALVAVPANVVVDVPAGGGGVVESAT